ncbi:MAG: diacylglycerol kinase family lipid kinase [Anaerolineales bacterium]|nr:diacylglycerol kinase family lipid kinase [Anaerolineales bacterium]
MKYLVIVNPISGRGHAEKMIPEIEAGMRKYNLEYELVRTERPWHAAEIAEEAARVGYDVIVLASGDGAANEAINGLMRARAAGFNHSAFSILPVGTGNDMAFGLGVRGTLEESIATLAKNRRKRIDIGFVKGGDYPQGRYFVNGIGIGFDAVVGFVAVKIRWARGLLAYLIAVVQTVFIYYKAPTVEITYNDITYTQSSLMISIMNGQRMGGGFYMAPQGDPSDGHFDLCMVSNVGRARIFGLVPYFLKGTQASQPEVTSGRTHKINVKALKGALPAHCDGETLCESGQELSAEIIPAAVEIITTKV